LGLLRGGAFLGSQAAMRPESDWGFCGAERAGDLRRRRGRRVIWASAGRQAPEVLGRRCAGCSRPWQCAGCTRPDAAPGARLALRRCAPRIPGNDAAGKGLGPAGGRWRRGPLEARGRRRARRGSRAAAQQEMDWADCGGPEAQEGRGIGKCSLLHCLLSVYIYPFFMVPSLNFRWHRESSGTTAANVSAMLDSTDEVFGPLQHPLLPDPLPGEANAAR